MSKRRRKSIGSRNSISAIAIISTDCRRISAAGRAIADAAERQHPAPSGRTSGRARPAPRSAASAPGLPSPFGNTTGRDCITPTCISVKQYAYRAYWRLILPRKFDYHELRPLRPAPNGGEGSEALIRHAGLRPNRIHRTVLSRRRARCRGNLQGEVMTRLMSEVSSSSASPGDSHPG